MQVVAVSLVSHKWVVIYDLFRQFGALEGVAILRNCHIGEILVMLRVDTVHVHLPIHSLDGLHKIPFLTFLTYLFTYIAHPVK